MPAAVRARRGEQVAAPQSRRSADLSVVRGERVRRYRPLVLAAVAVYALAAFAAVGMQISTINRGHQLDRIRSEIADIQERNKVLRQRESLLQAPAEILRIAEDELGMVKARESEVVVPATRVIGTPPAESTTGTATNAMGGE